MRAPARDANEISTLCWAVGLGPQPSRLFQDVNRGALIARAAASTHNLRLSAVQPCCLRRWLLVFAIALCPCTPATSSAPMWAASGLVCVGAFCVLIVIGYACHLVVVELCTLGGDPEVARRMREDVRYHSEAEPERRIVFLGKAAIYPAGTTFISFFAMKSRYLT